MSRRDQGFIRDGFVTDGRLDGYDSSYLKLLFYALR